MLGNNETQPDICRTEMPDIMVRYDQANMFRLPANNVGLTNILTQRLLMLLKYCSSIFIHRTKFTCTSTNIS